ncbi:MAG: glutamate 5-kinase [Pseudomonadota bacterium]
MTDETHDHQTHDPLASARRIVVKVGSALVAQQDGGPAQDWLNALADDLAAIKKRDADILIVSSGAVALGAAQLGLTPAQGASLRLEEKQAAAAAGQLNLMNAWRSALSGVGVNVAQILLTLDDTEDRRRYLNARATLETLLDLGALPIVNENDTIATDEIRYGDNDRLAGHLAQMVGADLMIMLSDVDGLYTSDPHTDRSASHIPVIRQIDEAVVAAAGGPNKARGAGSGGMATKIEAARIAVNAGCAAIVARGDGERPLSALRAGARRTLFEPQGSPEKARRSWIAGRLQTSGSVTIDAGALAALRNGASLLPAGVSHIGAAFSKGDAISIRGPDGDLVATGLSAYDSSDAARITGKKSDEIEEILGYRRAALVHRNDLVMVSSLSPNALSQHRNRTSTP